VKCCTATVADLLRTRPRREDAGLENKTDSINHNNMIIIYRMETMFKNLFYSRVL